VTWWKRDTVQVVRRELHRILEAGRRYAGPVCVCVPEPRSGSDPERRGTRGR